MVYLERIERGGRTYYYVTKNFRIGNGKWKKVRKYIGDGPPSPERTKKAAQEIESKALEKGLMKPASRYAYLSDEEAEKLQDLKNVFGKWYGRLSAVERKKNDEDFIVRFTYNSNAIEGNRLSLRETSMILTENVVPAGATLNDLNETINSQECYKFIREYRGEFNQRFLLKIHGMLTKNTDYRVTGEYRDHDVRISGSEWIPPAYETVKEEMRKVHNWYYSARKKLHPVELTAVLHNKLVRIHPFIDGNGRTSRVVMNWFLMKNGFPMICIELRDKFNYYGAIEEGDNGNDDAIVHYIANALMGQHTFRSRGDRTT
ncbi:MAG: Fic family protein [Candidatus Undinarchaeales archaeon]|nr:Fic family protein [Candidatus Undinarchaeales archaeon]